MDSVCRAQHLNEFQNCEKTPKIFTYLSNVNISTILVDLRVVLIQDAEVDASGSRDNVAIIVCLNYVSGSAVLSRPSETVGVTNNEVVASVVNDSIVHDRKLVTTGVKLSAEEIQQRWELCIRGNLVSSRDTVTDITTLSNVTASAGRRSNCTHTRKKWKKNETTEQPHARRSY